MLNNYKTKSVLIIDLGLFVDLACHLSKFFGRTYYYSEWKSQLPTSNRRLIGTGLSGVTKVDDFWDVIDDADLIVFPDLFFGGLQHHLRQLGKRVWGSGHGEELEIYRDKSKKQLKRLGISISPYKVLTGMEALREYLKEHDDQYVKINQHSRGDCETFHAETYELIQPQLDEIAHHLGAGQETMLFIVEETIKKSVSNLGYDCYTVDGKFPQTAMCGLEIKDRGYIGIVKEKEAIPKPLSEVNDKLRETLRRYQYRNFFTVELSIVKNGYFAVDPTARFSSPPGELYYLMYSNLPDILYFGASGELIEPEMAGKYGAQLTIYSEFAQKEWQPIQFPEKLRDHIKLRNLATLGGKYHVIPQSTELAEIGGVVAVGDSLEDVIVECKDIAEQVKGFKIKLFPETLDAAQEEIDKLRDCGVEL